MRSARYTQGTVHWPPDSFLPWNLLDKRPELCTLSDPFQSLGLHDWYLE